LADDPKPDASPAVAISPAPVAPAPAGEAAPIPVAAPAPVAVAEAPVAEAPKPFSHTDTPTLLQDAGKPEGEKPAEVKAEPEKPAEAKIEAAPEAKPDDKPAEKAPEPPAPEIKAEPRVYEAFKLPEGLTADEKQIGEFTGILDNAALSPQERAQQLMDLHGKAMQTFAERTLENQHRAFADMRKGWRTQVMADEEIGGAGHQTAMTAIARMRDMLVPQKDRKAFEEFLLATGAGDHPAFLRILHNAARHFDEPAVPAQTPKPAPNNGRRPGSKMSRLYENPPTAA